MVVVVSNLEASLRKDERIEKEKKFKSDYGLRTFYRTS